MPSPLDSVNELLAAAFAGQGWNVYPFDVDVEHAPSVSIIGPTEVEYLGTFGTTAGATPASGLTLRYIVRCQALRADPSSARRELNEWLAGSRSVWALLGGLSAASLSAAGVDGGWPTVVRAETSFEVSSERVHASVDFDVEVML